MIKGEDEDSNKRLAATTTMRWRKNHHRKNSSHRHHRRLQRRKSALLVAVVFAVAIVSLIDAFSHNNNNNNMRRRSVVKGDYRSRTANRKNNSLSFLQKQQRIDGIGNNNNDDGDDGDYVDIDNNRDVKETDFNTRSKKHLEKPPPNRKNGVNHLVLAAALFTATTLGGVAADLDPTSGTNNNNYNYNNFRANAAAAIDGEGLNLVSAGTPVIETKIVGGDPAGLIRTTETTLRGLARTTVLDRTNRVQLSDSIRRIRNDITTELTTVEAWKDVVKLLKEYGVDLRTNTDIVLRPPSNWKTAYDDFVNDKQVTLLVNGEILRFQLEHNTPSGKETTTTTTTVEPDDEWVLRIRGYKGFDPNNPGAAKNSAAREPFFRYRPPQWRRGLDEYWYAPLAAGAESETDPLSKVTNGDVIVFGGGASIALSYALSYAYYTEQIEKRGETGRKRQKKRAGDKAAEAKKEAAARAAVRKAKESATELEERLEKAAAAAAANSQKKPSTTSKPKAKPKKKPSPPPKMKEEEERTAKVEPPKAASSLSSPPSSMIPPAEVNVAKEKAPAPAAVQEQATKTSKTEIATKLPEVPADSRAVAVAPATVAAIDDTLQDDDDAVDDVDDDVRVVIAFDENGKVVLQTTSVSPFERKENILSFFQALYLPWLGFFISSSSSIDNRPGITRFAQALWFPWAGIFFPKPASTTETTIAEREREMEAQMKQEAEANGKDVNTGVVPFLRALWFPWVGIFQGK